MRGSLCDYIWELGMKTVQHCGSSIESHMVQSHQMDSFVLSLYCSALG